MTRKDRPPGGDSRGPEDTSPAGRESAVIVPPGDDDDPVAAKLWRLHYRYGYFTRAELGVPAPRGPGECPGEFGPDGTFREHCGSAA